jgi:DNA transformation protein and related proteins
MSKISAMLGLGPRSEEMLASAGITTAEELRALGAIQAFLAVKRAGQPASLNLLWALEGALTGQHWKDVARVDRTRLLIALDHAEQMA